MNTKSKEVGIKVHNTIGFTFKAIGRGIAKGAKVTYAKALTPAGHGIKAGAVAVKDFSSGLVLGERDIAAEQRKLEQERIQRFRELGGVIDPDTKLYQWLKKD